MVKVRMSYFAGENIFFYTPRKERDREREEREKKKKENTILTIGQERLFQSETMEREKRRSEKILRKEKNEKKYRSLSLSDKR